MARTRPLAGAAGRATGLDLDRYLDRIGLRDGPGLAEVHRAHATSIPFENLDPHRGEPVSLAPQDLERKLVVERRGGYCFEQNLLLKAALEAPGAEVELFLARVRVARAGTPTSALARGTLVEPIRFGPGGPYEQSGWRFRVVHDGPELVLQAHQRDGWTDLYGFVPEPVPLIDVEVSNWFTSTHPRSPFVTGLIVCAHRPDGRRTVLSDWDGLELREETAGEARTHPVAREAVPELLSREFGLDGFALDPDGRLAAGPKLTRRHSDAPDAAPAPGR